MRKNLFIAIVFLSLFIFSTRSVLAANVSFDAPASIKTGEILDVVVNTDTGGVLINSVELVLEYNQDLLSFTGYSDDNAIVKLWIDPPHAEQSKIYLSGIIPGGVLGLYDAKKKDKPNELSPIPLVHLFFVAKREGNAKFSFVTSKILKHDGVGTPLSHEELGSQVIIENNPDYIEKQAKESTTNNNIPNTPKPLNSTFWIILLVVISGIVGYKLLRYKYEKLSK